MSSEELTTTVVVPAYNEADCIGECLEALFNGSLMPNRVIVADGKSEDDTIAIAEEFDVTIAINQKLA